ncbi:hypothetical protein OG453_44250 [Streptomyces sp. NBC_01381]|uniref:effector-associated constant component EACC1 n=1 Tax=Streptomyces sp. NBC_01381 TaxID=2903845 RepID=UPI002254036B|nr:hypothetical protein [Streptomyces sp. NBC_01381]MCX4673571.1 hypothetical protein [Streptomyces sp. NBC_01381]
MDALQVLLVRHQARPDGPQAGELRVLPLDSTPEQDTSQRRSVQPYADGSMELPEWGGDLQVTFQIAGDTVEDDARSLHDWLRLDRNMRSAGRIELTSSAQPRPGQQGSVLDLVSLALTGSFSAASLAVSIVSWRTTRPQEPTITVELENGSKVTITGVPPDEAQRLVEQLLGGE